MKRRDFIQRTTLSATAISVFPQLIHGQSTIPKAELIGQGSPDLIKKKGYRLRPQAARAFDAMTLAARKAGIDIEVVSSYRDYAHQNRIWEAKYKNFTAAGAAPLKAIEKIIEYSTIPGTSRHHWATDVDIIQAGTGVAQDVLEAEKFHGTGPFCELKTWLDEHSEQFGFYEVYTNAYGRKGFKYEPWHFSYAPLSLNYLKEYQKLDIAQILQREGLMGSDAFTEAFVNRYRRENLLDINPELLA